MKTDLGMKSALYPIAYPKSIAFFGASNNFDRMGTIILDSLKDLGFEGPVYPVHPNENEVLGYKAYASVEDLPEVPGLAILVLPTDVVNKYLETCGKKGTRHAVVVSGGFKEVGGKGPELEKELKQTAEKYGIRFLGPNCLGVANPHHRLNPTPFHYDANPGFIGLASQSGSFVTQMFNYLSGYGLGFSTAFSVGNEANIDIVDCMEYLATCPHTSVIALYIEGIRRGERFMAAARKIVQHKPVVALYIGGSEAGRRAGFSHTGSMAGPDDLYEGMFKQTGIIRAASLTEMFDFCWVLGTLPLPAGNRVMVQTHSGGPGATAADACDRNGMVLPEISDTTVRALQPFMPHTGTLGNPVDLTFSKSPMDYFTDIPAVLLAEENIDILLAYFLAPSAFIERALKQMGLTPEKVVEESRKLARDAAEKFIKKVKAQIKPVVGFTYRSLNEAFTRHLMHAGIPIFPDPTRASRALRALLDYKAVKDKTPEPQSQSSG
jgi:acetyl-CoA synthetase (ADP-forming)